MCLSCEDIARQIANQTPEKPLRGSHEKEYLLLIWYKSSDSITLLKAFALSHTAYYVRNFTRHFVCFSWALRHNLMQVALTATILTIEADQYWWPGEVAIYDMTANITAQANFQHAYQNQQTYALKMDAYMKGTCVCMTTAWSTGLWLLSTSLEIC